MLDLKRLADELDVLRERVQDGETLDEEEQDRLMALERLENSLGDLYGASDDGVYLIPKDEFKDYCRDLAEDCGYLNGKDNPLLNYVDWDAWAEDCSTDYSLVEFEGQSYYTRDI